MSNGNRTNLSDEWMRFGVLVAVLVGVILVVAISRPLIFEHIIPVILGEGFTLPQAELEPPERVAPKEAEPVAPEPAEGEAVEAESEVVEPLAEEEVPAAAGETQATEEGVVGVEGESPTAGEAEPATVDSAGPVTHVVRTGETLTSIAQQYDVTVSELVAVNGLTTPNRIRVGDTLTIPAR